MRKSQASSELLQKQRYCLTTGQMSCCSGSTGPTGPAGTPGTSVCYGPVFSGHVSQTATAPTTGVGVTGAYGLQADGTALLRSNGTNWVQQTGPASYYFMDSTAGTHPMYRVNDNDRLPTTVTGCNMIFDTNEGTLYTLESTGWQASVSLIGPPGPAPSGASANTASYTIPISSTLTGTALVTTPITPDTLPSSIQVTATFILNAGTGEGVLYAVINGTAGSEFPYTANSSRPTTLTFTQMFSGVTASSVPILVSIYGKTTNSTETTGTCTVSIIYNLA